MTPPQERRREFPCPRKHCGGWVYLEADGRRICNLCGREFTGDGGLKGPPIISDPIDPRRKAHSYMRLGHYR